MPDKTTLIPTEPEGRKDLVGPDVAFHHNLPAPLTSFVGRQREVEALHNLLRHHRLLTLTGPGGSGKTRLALEVARQVLPRYAHGVFIVNLAPLDGPELVLNAIIETLGLQERVQGPPLPFLRHFLGTRELLLLLDNFEHLLGAALQLVDLLEAAPDLTILATSREPLRLYGEQEYPVLPLGLPEKESDSEETVLQAPAGRLFVERARAVQPHLELNAESAAAVAAICILLDGLPLALELAAARTRIFTPPALLVRLQKAAEGRAMHYLSDGARNLPDRLQTMQAAIDWSYHLLMAEEQSLFRRLAVFAGGCSIEAVATICFDDDRSEPEILDLLTSLVAKSLLQVKEGSGSEPRFSLLHVLREYARERLLRQGEALEVGERHARFYLSLPLQEEDREARTASLDAERDNMRHALVWAEKHHSLQMALAAAPRLAEFWSRCGWTGEGGRWMEQLVAESKGSAPALRAEILMGAYLKALAQGDMPSALAYCEATLEIYYRAEDPENIANTLLDTANCHLMMGELENAKTRLEETVALLREGDDLRTLVIAITMLGTVAWHTGDIGRAVALYDEAMKAPLPQTPVLALIGSGILAAELGDYERGQTLLHQALERCLAQNRPMMVANARSNIGLVALRAGKLAEARTYLAEGLRGWNEVGYSPDHTSLDGLARLAALDGDSERAVRLWAAADYFDLGIGLDPPERDSLQEMQAAVRARLGSERFEQLLAEGRRIAEANPQAVVAFALEASTITAPTPPEPSAGRWPFELTARQVEVLRLVAQGLSDAQVAEELVLSQRTVGNHLTAIFQKLDVHSRTAAARVARENNLL